MVVVGVDGSDGSDQAVRDAARLFAGANARIVLVTAVDPDVVVLDRRGSGLSHRLLSSGAERALRHSAVPVLLAESPERRGRASTPEKRDAAEGSCSGAASSIAAGTSRPTAS